MNKEEKKLLNYTAKKVENLFLAKPVPAHGIDHIKRVVKNTKLILAKEKVKNQFLCEMSAWLHDIGRTLEVWPSNSARSHHELSYELLRKWFREDRNFDMLCDQEKEELLYVVRYHWNDFADDYDTAWILRDADKIDVFGHTGLKRGLAFHGDGEKLEFNFRLSFTMLYFLHTKTARKIVEKKKLIVPIEKGYKKMLLSKIEKIEL